MQSMQLHNWIALDSLINTKRLHTLIVSISIDYGNLLVVLINNAIRT